MCRNRRVVFVEVAGCCNVSTKEEILSVGPSQPKIIGLPVMVGL